MVTNLYMKCEVCDSIINLKWQIGHIERAPVSIVCAECKTVLKFILITDQENITFDMKSKNATQVQNQDFDYIAETSSELLTFKITKQKLMQPGHTPFIRTIHIIGLENYQEYCSSFLKGISAYKQYSHIYLRINDLYYNCNYEYLVKQLKKYLEIDDSKEFTEIEIQENLYWFNIKYYSMFFKSNTLGKLNEENLRLMSILRGDKKEKYEDFLLNYCTDKMLGEFDNRLYKSINSILDNYYLFLPATILCYIDSSKHQQVLNDYTLTTTDFTDIKHIYLTVYENLLKVYDIIILLNNIIERNSYDSFPHQIRINRRTINSTEQFVSLTKGNKLKFLELNQHFDSLMPDFDRKIRNAIGHESWDYIPYDHKIEFYDEMKSRKEEIYLLDFVYKCWLLLDKIIIIYKVLQDIKHHRMLAINNVV